MTKTLAAALEEIQAQLQPLEVEEICARLRPFMVGMAASGVGIPAGSYVYRARRTNADFNLATPFGLDELGPPPVRFVTRPGRCNRAGVSVFYGSQSKEGAIFEIGPHQSGDHLVLSMWRVQEELVVHNLGYSAPALQRMGSKREAPDWAATPKLSVEDIAKAVVPMLSWEDNDAARTLLSNAFAEPVADREAWKYKLTAAVADLWMPEAGKDGPLAGIIYPALRLSGGGDNLALYPEVAASRLEFSQALLVEVTGFDAGAYSVNYLDHARTLNNDGFLDWRGRMYAWSIPPGATAVMTGVAGADPFGDYQASPGGERVHWTAMDKDTGAPIYSE
jgi:hypothetical protein